MNAALVIAEHDGSQIYPSTLSVVTAALELSSDVTILVVGCDCEKAAEQAAQIKGVQKIWTTDAPCYAHGLAENISSLIASLASDFGYVLAPSTAFGKNILPRVAGLLNVAPISDVIRIISPDTFVRPIYAGNALATVQSHDAIKLLTIRTTAYSAAVLHNEQASIERIALTIENTLSEWVSQQQNAQSRPDLRTARVIIAGGRGLGSAENFGLLEKIADKLGAAIGASRAAVDAGFAPNDWQIGQTGKVVAPDLYIAVGISGAIQHVAGMKDSKVIVAINQDPNASIFQVADYGLIGDLFEILPEMERLLSRTVIPAKAGI